MTKIALSLIVLMGSLLVGCTAPDPYPSASVFDTVNSTQLAKNISSAEYVMIGEKHDNPAHHKIQAELLQTFLKPGDLVVFEMINELQQPVIDQFLANKIAYEDLATELNWSEGGWPGWEYYGPLFKVSKDAGAQILYGSFPRQKLMKQGMLKIARPKVLSDEQMAELDQEIRYSHCKMLPENMVRPMSNLQVIKDDLMATQLRQKKDGAQAFLIAGNGHTRMDRGVPLHLQKKGEDNIFVLGLIEEEAEPAEWELFTTYNAIWITEGIGKTHEDYCKGLKKRFSSHKKN
ncbi:ChaN family lipoprotein [Sneathiella limimaris]|uniref:ChaN family lipoprotein n=1 Tax=Sneathiella limimaris TaxID=1964213 RepID=UPI00146D9E70|nr:ChaN family lipoprotein [Sneathiella limimaris]